MIMRNGNCRQAAKVCTASMKVLLILSSALILVALCAAGTAEAATQKLTGEVSQHELAAASAKAQAPARTIVTKASSTETSFRVSWGKSAQASGYQVRVILNGKRLAFKTLKGRGKLTATFKKLTPSTSYQVTVRAFSTAGASKKYSKWSKVKTVKTKEKTYKIVYDLGRGQQAQGQRMSFKESSKTFKLLNPTRECYVFLGWYDAGDGTRVKRIVKGTKRDISLVAKWTESHDYKPVDEVEPTCTENGYVIEACTICGDTVRTAIPETGHEMDSYYTTKPTCSSGGRLVHRCLHCGYSYTETVSATGEHDLVKHDAVSPTCTQRGCRQYWECDDCGKLFSDPAGRYQTFASSVRVEALGHNSTTLTTKTPTCTSSGTVEEYCWRCGYKRSYTVPSLGHNWTTGSSKSNYVCSNGHTFNSPRMIMKLVYSGGSSSYRYVNSCPTCSSSTLTRQNSTTLVCLRCGVTK